MEVYPKITTSEWDLLKDAEGANASADFDRVQAFVHGAGVVTPNSEVSVGPFFALRAAIDAAEQGDCSYLEHLSKVSDDVLEALRAKIQTVYVTRRAELLDQREKGSKK